MVEIGIEILQDQLGEYLQRARQGERIAITDPEGHPIAMLAPIEEHSRPARKASRFPAFAVPADAPLIPASRIQKILDEDGVV